jgi:adenylylsulfate kinase
MVLWLTGLSGSGKSAIARETEQLLHAMGRMTVLLDGDNLRAGLNNNLGFGDGDRLENIRRTAETAKLFAQNGLITFCALVSPTVAMRQLARAIIGSPDYTEVHIDTALELCEQRDVKGLYARARAGEIKDFTGISAPYEVPTHPELRVPTSGISPTESAHILLQYILNKQKPNP